MSVRFWNDSKEGIFKGGALWIFLQALTVQKQHMLGNLTSSAGSQKCLIWNHVKPCQYKCTQNGSSMEVSSQCFGFLQAQIENLIQSTQRVTPGLQAWDAMRRRRATSEARSEPTGRATHLLLHQDTLCCTPPEREGSAASRLWLQLHPSWKLTALARKSFTRAVKTNHFLKTHLIDNYVVKHADERSADSLPIL